MLFVLAYDVSEPRRLRRVARFLEKRALRCQYSVFLFQGDRDALLRPPRRGAAAARCGEDVLQAWAVPGGTDPELVRGTPRPIFPAGVVLAGRQALFVSPAAPSPGGRGPDPPIPIRELTREPDPPDPDRDEIDPDAGRARRRGRPASPDLPGDPLGGPAAGRPDALAARPACLAAAWKRIREAGGADTPGPDGQTLHHPGTPGRPLARRPGRRPLPQPLPPQGTRWVEIPKPDRPGSVRRLGILNVRDRVVQAALKLVLEPILEPVFLPGSFGFRPGCSTAGAVAAAARLLAAGRRDADAALGRAPGRGRLLPHHRPCLPPCRDRPPRRRHRLLRLVEHGVRAGGEAVGRLWWRRTCGLVQGSPLSPLLCNLALHPVDLALDRLGRDTQGGVAALRYADDLLILARDARLASRRGRGPGGPAQRAAGTGRRSGTAAGRRGRRLAGHPPPAAPPRPARPVEFGHVVPESKLAGMLARLTEMTTPPSDKIDASAFNPARWIVSINDQLRDWRQVYCCADNAPDLFRVLDDFTREAHRRPAASADRSARPGAVSQIPRASAARLLDLGSAGGPPHRAVVAGAAGPVPLDSRGRPGWAAPPVEVGVPASAGLRRQTA